MVYFKYLEKCRGHWKRSPEKHPCKEIRTYSLEKTHNNTLNIIRPFLSTKD
jgi:hypothetical protein